MYTYTIYVLHERGSTDKGMLVQKVTKKLTKRSGPSGVDNAKGSLA